jgi:hypothetical protein
MTDYGELIKQLRISGHPTPSLTRLLRVNAEAADALEAQAKEIERLEQESAGRLSRSDRLVDYIMAHDDRMAEIKDALKLVKINLHNTEYAGILTDLVELIEGKVHTEKTFDEHDNSGNDMAEAWEKSNV